jgi:hypothetical protein
MFDLEKSIAEWRRQMLNAGIKTPVPLEELENHLREEIERQIKLGQSEQQAFEMTVSQIGQGVELKTEFAKNWRLMSFLEIELVKKDWDLKSLEFFLRRVVPGGIAFCYGIIGLAWFLGARLGQLGISSADIALALAPLVPTLLLLRAARPLAKILPVIHEYWLIGGFFSLIILGAALIRVWGEILTVNIVNKVDLSIFVVNLSIIALWVISLGMGFTACFMRWFQRCETIRKNSYRHV